MKGRIQFICIIFLVIGILCLTNNAFAYGENTLLEQTLKKANSEGIKVLPHLKNTNTEAPKLIKENTPNTLNTNPSPIINSNDFASSSGNFFNNSSDTISYQSIKKFLSSVANPFHFQTPLSGGGGVTDVQLGYQYTCAITSTGKLYCWGHNSYGQVGDGTTKDKFAPTLISSLGDVKSVSTGLHHACAINSNDKLYCWGHNSYGQVGDGTTKDKFAPTLISSLGDVKSVKIGVDSNSVCAINSNDKLYCWGQNYFGQLGDGTTRSKLSPQAVSGSLASASISSVATRGQYACAITSANKLYCWGYNGNGQLGDGTTTNRSLPQAVTGDLTSTSVSNVDIGRTHTCAITSANKLYCWGWNRYGQVGDGTTNNRSTPTLINSLGDVKSVNASENYTCAINYSDNLYCWGYNNYGQLGNGNTTNQTTPQTVTGDLASKSIIYI